MRRSSTAPAPDASHQGVWNFDTSGESETDRCVALWRSVVIQAFQDCDTASRHREAQAAKCEAISFLTDAHGYWAASRHHVCAMAGIDPDRLRAAALRRGVQSPPPVLHPPARPGAAPKQKTAADPARAVEHVGKEQRRRRKSERQALIRSWRKANRQHPPVVALGHAERALELTKRRGAGEDEIERLKSALRQARAAYTAAFRQACPLELSKNP